MYDPSRMREEDPLFDDVTFKKFQQIRLNVSWDNVTLKAALEEMTAKSKIADQAHEGIKFVCDASLEAKKLSITLTDASTDVVLAFLRGQVKSRIQIHKGVVLILAIGR